jgi:hypothetical protein
LREELPECTVRDCPRNCREGSRHSTTPAVAIAETATKTKAEKTIQQKPKPQQEPKPDQEIS